MEVIERRESRHERWSQLLAKRAGEAIKIANGRWEEQKPMIWVDKRDDFKSWPRILKL